MNNSTNKRGSSPLLAQKKFPWTLFGLCLVFIGPLLLATLLYFFRDSVPFNTKLSGQLFNPPILADSLGWTQNENVKGKWQMVYCYRKKDVLERKNQAESEAEAENENENENQYDLLKRIHLALGKDQSRVILSSYHKIDKHETQGKQVIQRKPETQGKPSVQENQVFLIDPRGFIILSYPLPMQNPKGLLEDLRRLLRYSHVG